MLYWCISMLVFLLFADIDLRYLQLPKVKERAVGNVIALILFPLPTLDLLLGFNKDPSLGQSYINRCVILLGLNYLLYGFGTAFIIHWVKRRRLRRL